MIRVSLATAPESVSLERLYERAASLHGHMCPGVILGTRMAVLGMELQGLEPGAPAPDLKAYVETSRCLTDAVQATTGCTAGHRTLKVLDFGKAAATFALEGDEEAYRVVAVDSWRAAADRLHPEISDRRGRQIAAYRELPDDALFEVARVRLLDRPGTRPREARRKAACPRCGEAFEERRGVMRAEGLVCASCAGWSYYDAAFGPVAGGAAP